MDDRLRDSLDRLDEEHTSDLLDKEINFEIDEKTVKRIKSSVYKKVGINKKPSVFSRKFMACAAAVILVFCTMLALNFDNIVAAVQHAIEYIPGFGSVPEKSGKASENSERDMLEVKVMKQPVSLEVQGGRVEIYSSWLSIYKDQIIVTAILRYPQNINLDGEIAIEYNGEKILRDGEFLDFSYLNHKEKNKEMTYIYTIRNPKDSVNSLTFMTEASRADIAYEKTEDLRDKVISQNFNGIIVSAIPLNKERSRFILTSTYERNFEGVRFISALATGMDSKIKAIDEAGKEHEIKKSTSQGNEYYVEGKIKGRIVSLKFNKLYQGFVFENSKSLQGVKFKVPKADERVEINKSLDNELCSIDLKTVEKDKSTEGGVSRLVFTYETKSKIPGFDISYTALYLEKDGMVRGNTVLDKRKQGDVYIIRHNVIADKNAEDNTVTIVPFPGSYFWNMMLLDKECVFNFK